MTWFEWICSEYNNVEIDGGLIGIDSDGYININENWIVHTNIDASVDYGVYLGEEIGVFDYQLYEY